MLRLLIPLLFAMTVALPKLMEAQESADSALAVVDSARGDQEFKDASARYMPMVRGCYEREGLRSDPSLSATVEVGLTVQADGSVREISVDTATVSGVGIAGVAQCVSQAAVRWRFVAGTYAVERAILTFRLVAPQPLTSR